MLTLKRINWSENNADYQEAWSWMREQPELYSDDIGYDSFGDFAEGSPWRIEFALRENDELIAFAYLVYKRPKTCEFGLITPPRPRVRSILALLEWLQRDYFETLGFAFLYALYPDDPRYDRPRRLCRMFGWRPIGEHAFGFSILDHLKSQGAVQ